MIDERSRVVSLIALAYILSIASYATALNVFFGVELSRDWLRWYWTVATVTGIRTTTEIIIFAATAGGLVIVALLPPLLIGLTPWRIDAYGGCKSAYARWGDIYWLRFRYGIRLSRSLKEGFVLGRDAAKRWVISTKAFYAMLFGPAGEGKTAAVLIPSTLNLPSRSLIINDPAGEIYDATAGARSKIGRVIRLEWGSPNSDGFNPLARGNMPADQQAVCDQIDTLAAILIPPEGKSNATSDFFTTSARSALAVSMAFHYFGRASVDKDTSVGDVLTWLSMLGHREPDEVDPDEEDPVGNDLRDARDRATDLDMPARVIEAMNSFATMNRKTRGDVITTIRDDKLSLWRNDYVRSATSRSTFALTELDDPKGKPVTIYLVVPVADQERYGKATGLFIEAFYTYATRGSVGRQRRRVSLILDELKFIPPLRAVKDGPSILRKFKVDGLLGFQDRAQVVDVYDESTLSGFDQNCIAQIIFTLGHQETAEWVAKAIGNRWALKRVTQGGTIQPTNMVGSSSTTNSTEAVPLMTAQDVMSLASGRHLVLLRSKPHRPIYARSPMYFKTQPFKRLSRQTVKTA